MNATDNTTNLESQTSEAEPQQENALDSCRPVQGSLSNSVAATTRKLRRSRRDEPFTSVSEPTVIACIVDRKRDNWGNQFGEEYYPVEREHQTHVGPEIRSIAFHPCVTATGETFIYPQKQDPPHTWANSWNASLAQALALPPGQWRTIWSDKEAECYQHEMVDPPKEGVPEYRNFREDLEQALTPNIIASLNHPILLQHLGQQDTVADDQEID